MYLLCVCDTSLRYTSCRPISLQISYLPNIINAMYNKISRCSNRYKKNYNHKTNKLVIKPYFYSNDNLNFKVFSNLHKMVNIFIAPTIPIHFKNVVLYQNVPIPL